MGTLTADCPRLDAHCPHKLATSCRLTSTPNCCACADERAHSRTYRVYIDGIGFVQRGTRWQGYCWFCKEFWSNRLAATEPPLEISQTRIPEIPDQADFLERWFEFHQGYRVAKLPDGTEQRMPVIGEPFKEVSPGFLPRTLDQLRAGVENDAQRPENRLRRRRLSSEEAQADEPHQSLESALDSLLAEASDDENSPPSEETPPPLPPPPAVETPHLVLQQDPRPLNRGEARLQRARERFARVFGTREDIQQEDYESPLSAMYNRAYDRYRQAEERRATDTTSPPPLDGLSAQERREIEEQLLWGVMRDSAAHHDMESEHNVWSYAPRRPADPSQPTTRGLPPPPAPWTHAVPGGSDAQGQAAFQPRRRFGSRSPAARTRFPVSPTLPSTTITAGPSQRPSTTITVGPNQRPLPSDGSTSPGQEATAFLDRTAEFERLRRQFDLITESERDLARRHAERQAPSPSAALGPQQPTDAASPSGNENGNGMSQIQTSITQITSELQRLRLASEAITSARYSMHGRLHPPDQTAHTLDSQPDRPAPLTDEEMTKSLACQVCYQQLANIAVLPCGHMVMCQWCADVVIPVKHSHLPIRQSRCPMCRKIVKQRFKIHVG